jgi:exodeoxyribonuclease VII small subunit
MNQTQQTYRQSISELEEIVKAIQSGNIDVDELTSKVTRAADLIRICKAKLTNAESAVAKVLAEIEPESKRDNS